MKDIAKMNFSEFCEYLDGEGYNRFDPVLSYDEFTVYLDIETGKYYFLEGGEGDADEFFEVELAAVLLYDENHDIKLKKGETLQHLFNCCACGEEVTDEGIKYMWFSRVDAEEEEDE